MTNHKSSCWSRQCILQLELLLLLFVSMLRIIDMILRNQYELFCTNRSWTSWDFAYYNEYLYCIHGISLVLCTRKYSHIYNKAYPIFSKQELARSPHQYYVLLGHKMQIYIFLKGGSTYFLWWINDRFVV